MEDLLATLVALEQELHHPGIPASPERLEALLHPAFFEVGKSGLRYSRQQVVAYLSQLTQPPVVISSDHEVHGLAPDSALLTYACTHVGENANIEVLRSSIWRRTAVGWQLFYHQGTLVGQP
ncbi:MAG: DUF4440 domain-containing protein [Rubrivivax sp.]|nr:MAG: DUF4440 domain-containing protein [Rubrivivax sp.]